MFGNEIKEKKAGIVCCSNGIHPSYGDRLEELSMILKSIGLEAAFSSCIYAQDGVFSGTAKERADALMAFYKDDTVSEIFDISGGDVANGILPYLDYQVIGNSGKRFWGYSDLTTVLNAIYTKTGNASMLYQIRNVMAKDQKQKIGEIKGMLDGETCLAADTKEDSFVYLKQSGNAFEIPCTFLQGEHMEGVVIGGNIRCFLKLAGTEYLPDFQDKILLLESRGGTVAQMETYLSQLQQLGAFDKCSGILLGTFTQMEAEHCKPEMGELLLAYVRENLPVAVTKKIGHGRDAKGILIGKYAGITLKKRSEQE